MPDEGRTSVPYGTIANRLGELAVNVRSIPVLKALTPAAA
jgi:hypothetical protein